MASSRPPKFRALLSLALLLLPAGPAEGGAVVPVAGTTLEQVPWQEVGGGYNSTLSAGRVTMAEPLAPGASVSVQFRLGVARPGAFRFFVNVEATTAAAPNASDAGSTPKRGAVSGRRRRAKKN